MIIVLLLFISISNALSLKQEHSVFHFRISTSYLFLTGLIWYPFASLKWLEKDIDLYGNLFNTSQTFSIFIVITKAIILLIMASFFYPRDRYYLTFSKLPNNKNSIYNEKGKHFSIIEYPLIIIFVITGCNSLIAFSDIVSIFLSIELQICALYLLCTLYRYSKSTLRSAIIYLLVVIVTIYVNIILLCKLFWSFIRWFSYLLMNSLLNILELFIVQSILCYSDGILFMTGNPDKRPAEDDPDEGPSNKRTRSEPQAGDTSDVDEGETQQGGGSDTNEGEVNTSIILAYFQEKFISSSQEYYSKKNETEKLQEKIVSLFHPRIPNRLEPQYRAMYPLAVRTWSDYHNTNTRDDKNLARIGTQAAWLSEREKVWKEHWTTAEKQAKEETLKKYPDPKDKDYINSLGVENHPVNYPPLDGTVLDDCTTPDREDGIPSPEIPPFGSASNEGGNHFSSASASPAPSSDSGPSNIPTDHASVVGKLNNTNEVSSQNNNESGYSNFKHNDFWFYFYSFISTLFEHLDNDLIMAIIEIIKSFF